MRIIAITGGKGGTGKSTVATALAYALAKDKKVLLVDADVDCPNDHLMLSIKREDSRPVEQRMPSFELEKCTKCGACGKACKNKAIVSLPKTSPIFIENQCNGCGACMIVCPSNAISWDKKEIGRVYSGKREKLDFLGGDLKANQPISEFIVNKLNEEIEKIKGLYDYIIIDTAAGTHCPVIAALENADEVIAVTEPTPLGAHDLEIILRLLSDLGKRSRIIINRSDVGDKKQLLELSEKFKAIIALEIPYSDEIVSAYSKGEPIIIKGLLPALGVGME